MSKVKNIPKRNNKVIKAVRQTLEHRGMWLYLLLNEAEKKGLKWEDFSKEAIKQCGCIQGKELSDNSNAQSFKGLKKQLFTLPAQMVFEMKILEYDDNKLSIDFGYCPLVHAWQKLGCSDEEISRLCDIAMEGDRGIAKSFGGEMNLGKTIANGDDKCEIRFSK
ncbi:MAG: L-2-amino-thiazoline-4-carboxylic acid hydrolase [Terrisporobacter sp.]|uniref:L-2-amino-thiazoline-4-carboxylic acid hydrolase n=1 Tax=Terrisporobacter sp. TaxID=1965305 RepID=UPI002FCBF486